MSARHVVARRSRRRRWLVVATMMVWLLPVGGQQLLDRVVARVNGYAITLTDVNAAVELGVVDAPAGEDRQAAATERLIERQLVLGEVARFVPPEPDAAAVDREVARMIGRVGPRLAAVMASTGVDEARIREVARDTLRIQAYLDQRFGTTVQVSAEEVVRYYRAHPDEFTRDGMLLPFEEAEPLARRRAAAERHAATIAQWLRDLRARAEVVEPKTTTAPPGRTQS
ncbi:MAG: hypothetical protein HY657_03805 [Acidobacteria bacterium]|nr:hypothetical protein [Acidobacteriota bacterium]